MAQLQRGRRRGGGRVSSRRGHQGGVGDTSDVNLMVPEGEAKLLRLLRTMLALTLAPAQEGAEAAVGARAGLAEDAAQHPSTLLTCWATLR